MQVTDGTEADKFTVEVNVNSMQTDLFTTGIDSGVFTAVTDTAPSVDGGGFKPLDLTVLNNGNVIVYYINETASSDFFDIIAPDGTTLLGGATAFTFDPSNSPNSVDVTALDNGKFAFTWVEQNDGTSDWDIYFRILNADGTESVAKTNAFDNGGTQRYLEATALANGDLLLLYSMYDGGTNSGNVLAQRIDGGTGTILDTTPVTLFSVPNSEPEPLTLTQLTDGDILAVFQEGNSDRDIRVVRVDADLSSNKSDFVAVTPGSDVDGGDLNVAALSNGGYAFAYADGNNVHVRVYGSSDSLVSTISWTDLNDISFSSGPVIEPLAGGGFVVAITDYDGTQGDHVAQIFDDSGAAVSARTNLDPVGFDADDSIRMTPTNDGGFVAYVRKYDANSEPDLAVELRAYQPTGSSPAYFAGDTTPPTVTSIVRQSPVDATTEADEVTFRVTFSENMDPSTIQAADFALSGTAAADGAIGGPIQVAGNPAAYDVTITGITSSNGTLNLDLAGGATLEDAAGNALTELAVTGTDETYTIANNTAPSIGVNTGSALNEGATDTVITAELQATDAEEAAEALTYTLDSTVANGTLWLDDGNGVLEVGEGLAAGENFTQADIDAGHLRYTHDGGETISDGFQFDVSDGTDTVENQTFTFTINPVNDAPALIAAAPTLSAIDEDATNNGGQTIGGILGASVSDPDGAAQGIALTELNSGNGTWQYSLDSGNNWNDAGTVANTSALLLRASDYLRFVPNGESGTAASVTYRAWDQTNGTAGTRVDVSGNGGTTAFSSATDTASITVTDVNDTPTASGLPADITATEDTASNVDLSGVVLTDVDGDVLTVTLTASAGVLNASAGLGVSVGGDGTGLLTLNGTAAAITTYLDTASSITYTGPADLFGEDAATISVNVDDGTVNPVVGTLKVDIADALDSQTGDNTPNTLVGDGGRDVLIGLGGNDLLLGFAGDDSIVGGDGRDTLGGGSGADTLEGGNGADVASYTGSSAAVTIDLNDAGGGFQSASGGDAEGDVLSGIRRVWGSDFGDLLTGDEMNNLFYGRNGSDTIAGGEGNDTIGGGGGGDADELSGGAGRDLLTYTGSSAAIIIDLNDAGGGLQSASGGDATGDVISGFENIWGSDFGDSLTGDAKNNVLFGRDGADTILGGDGNDTIGGGGGADADSLSGGDGTGDVLSYTGSAGAVTIDLNDAGGGFQSASGGDATGDVISGFERVWGSDFDDTLTGDANNNVLFGRGGADTIDGGNGNDTIGGGSGGDADHLAGGDGRDVLSYILSFDAVSIDLNDVGGGFQSASGGDASGDVISGFETVWGSSFGDTLTGDAIDNLLSGRDGADTLSGGDGNDTLIGGDDADTFLFNRALGAGNVDRIADFDSSEDDYMLLDKTIFTALASSGSLLAAEFRINTNGLAEASDDRIVYNTDTGELFYDADGLNGAAAVQFAVLTGAPGVDVDDFLVI